MALYQIYIVECVEIYVALILCFGFFSSRCFNKVPICLGPFSWFAAALTLSFFASPVASSPLVACLFCVSQVRSVAASLTWPPPRREVSNDGHYASSPARGNHRVGNGWRIESMLRDRPSFNQQLIHIHIFPLPGCIRCLPTNVHHIRDYLPTFLQHIQRGKKKDNIIRHSSLSKIWQGEKTK